jgi:hypothetical protein
VVEEQVDFESAGNRRELQTFRKVVVLSGQSELVCLILEQCLNSLKPVDHNLMPKNKSLAFSHHNASASHISVEQNELADLLSVSEHKPSASSLRVLLRHRQFHVV